MRNDAPHDRALVGKAGEALVAGQLLRRQVDVAYPAYDGGIDLIAYTEHKLSSVVPIQVKTASDRPFAFFRSWFRIENIVLVHIWRATTSPEYYIFANIAQIEDALGPHHTQTDSWRVQGRYSVTRPNQLHIDRMQPHRDKWERIVDRIKTRTL